MNKEQYELRPEFQRIVDAGNNLANAVKEALKRDLSGLIRFVGRLVK